MITVCCGYGRSSKCCLLASFKASRCKRTMWMGHKVHSRMTNTSVTPKTATNLRRSDFGQSTNTEWWHQPDTNIQQTHSTMITCIASDGSARAKMRRLLAIGLVSLGVLLLDLTIAGRISRDHGTLTRDTNPWPSTNSTATKRRRLDDSSTKLPDERKGSKEKKLRILYTVTTLAEYDTGGRATTKGYDRLQGTLIPVLRAGVESMLSFGYDVDVFLVCHYAVQPERLELVRKALPESVGIQAWNESTPLAYLIEPKKTKVVPYTLALARQHRFVIKDKLFEYDFFVSFEDDMVITGAHVENYLDMTRQLYQLREEAPEHDEEVTVGGGNTFYGTLTKSRLKRMFPGLLRVEVLLDEANYGTQEQLDPIPITNRPHIDPKPCCHLPEYAVSPGRPADPDSDKLFMWETGIFSLGVRKMPSLQNAVSTTSQDLGWVLMQRGPVLQGNLTIKDFWSGTGGLFKGRTGKGGERRPNPKAFDHINNQGGWMATRQQIWEWHTEICPGGFLPPFDPGHYNFDGLDMRNVEYWSGGLSLFTKQHACNMQRIVSLEPDRFARHLIYHAANNKQRQLHGQRRRFVKVNDLLGQLNTVRNNAQTELERQ